MKLKLLATVASVAFISTGVAYAQDNPAHKDQRPAQESAQPRAPAAAPRNQAAPRAAAQAEPRKDELKAGEGKTAEPRAAKTEARKDEMKSGEGKTAEPRAAKTEARKDELKAGEDKTAEPRAAKTEARKDEMNGGEKGAKADERTAQHQRRGAPSVQGKVNISSEHATRVSEVLRQHSRPERVNAGIRVGERIPTNIEVRPLPPEVIALVPEYRGYDYFVDSDDEIVFVSPESHEIVGMIDYGSADGPIVAGARPCPVEN